jgi:hypothetical protein
MAIAVFRRFLLCEEGAHVTADIVDFPMHRFTIADLEHLAQISENMIARGIWHAWKHDPDRGAQGLRYERWLVFTVPADDAAFSIERRSTGRYFLTDARSGACLLSGRTLQEVTQRWATALLG